MYTEIIRKSDNVQINLGDFIYHVTEYGKFRRKINWLGEHFIEWSGGYCSVDEIQVNQDTKSKVKFIVQD